MKNTIRKLIAAAMAAVLLIAAMPAASAAAKRTAEVVADTMPVYAKANSNSQYLGSLSSGTLVTVSGDSGSWSRVHYRGRTGYARTSNLSYAKLYIGFVNTDTTVFAAPSEFSDAVTVEKGFPVYVVGETDGFYVVKNRAGTKGYMLMHELSKTLPTGCNPFSSYDPLWEKAPAQPMLMLHSGSKVRNEPKQDADFAWMKRDTACKVVGKKGEYYIVMNPANSAIAYLHPDDLYVGVSWAA